MVPVVCQADVIWIITAVDVRRDDWSAASTQTVVKCRANATQRHCGTFLLSGSGVPLLLTATKMMSSLSFLAVFVYAFLWYTGLWRFYRVGNLHKLVSAYVKCIKTFFGYNKYYSVTQMLIHLGLPSFNTVIYNAQLTCNNRLKSSVNSLVQTALLV